MRLIWKDNPLPFHKQAKAAATLARVAYLQRGLPGFWQAHDALFENQRDIETGLEQIAGKLDLSWPVVKSAKP